MFVCEPSAIQRKIEMRLKDTDDNPLSTAHTFVSGDLKLVQPDGTVAASTNLPTGNASGLAGTFSVQLTIAEIAQIGNLRLQLSASGVAIWEWSETIRPIDCLYYGVVASVVDTTHLQLDASSPGGAAVALDGFYAESAVSRACIVRVIGGTGAGQTRLGVDYVGATHTLQIGEPFIAALDTTSILRLEDAPLGLTVGNAQVNPDTWTRTPA